MRCVIRVEVRLREGGKGMDERRKTLRGALTETAVNSCNCLILSYFRVVVH